MRGPAAAKRGRGNRTDCCTCRTGLEQGQQIAGSTSDDWQKRNQQRRLLLSLRRQQLCLRQRERQEEQAQLQFQLWRAKMLRRLSSLSEGSLHWLQSVQETWLKSCTLMRQSFRQQYLRRRLLLRLRQAKAEAVLRYGRQLPPDPEVLYWQQAQVEILSRRNRQLQKLLAQGAVLVALPLLGAVLVALPLLILPWSQGKHVLYLPGGGRPSAVQGRIDLLDQFIRDECRRLKFPQRPKVCRR